MTTEEKFHAAVEIINSLPRDGTFQPSEDLMLKLYAYQKQAIEGPCKSAKPSIWNMSSRIKWNAWNELGTMTKEVAMEKYVGELTKIIETMSYNEKVSKFMSLIGPFYEVVSSDEIDSSCEKINQKKPAEYCFPKTALELLQDAEHESSQVTLPAKSHTSKKNEEFSISDDFIKDHMPEVTPFNLLSGLQNAKLFTERDPISIFKSKSGIKSQPFSSQKDLLVLTVINLQNSLEDIVRRLEKLNTLAKDVDFKKSELEKKSIRPDSWNLNFAGTAFALLWPLAVHLYMGSL